MLKSKRILRPDGKPFTTEEYEMIFQQNPELRGRLWLWVRYVNLCKISNQL